MATRNPKANHRLDGAKYLVNHGISTYQPQLVFWFRISWLPPTRVMTFRYFWLSWMPSFFHDAFGLPLGTYFFSSDVEADAKVKALIRFLGVLGKKRVKWDLIWWVVRYMGFKKVICESQKKTVHWICISGWRVFTFWHGMHLDNNNPET